MNDGLRIDWDIDESFHCGNDSINAPLIRSLHRWFDAATTTSMDKSSIIDQIHDHSRTPCETP